MRLTVKSSHVMPVYKMIKENMMEFAYLKNLFKENFNIFINPTYVS
jgi:hypothetical protein